jgi:hypothetical protein
METLRREMTENGIEPRQIFGFDPEGLKNAADIELVIDAMDLAYLRPEIRTYVLVTRDGGFASLARKLHELGKSVVVCSGPRCSHALRSVADRFIYLPEPEEGISAVADDGDRGDTATRERQLETARSSVLEQIRELVDGDARLETEGIQLTELGQRFRVGVPTLAVDRSGYPGLREFLQWALAGSGYAVIRRLDGPEGAKVRLGRRGHAPPGCEELPNVEKRLPRSFPDQASLYQFHASQGKPSIRLASPAAIARVLAEMAGSWDGDENIIASIDRTARALDGSVTAENVKFTVVALSYGDAKPGMTAAQLRASLLTTIRKKLATRLGQVDDAVLESLID